MTGSAEQSGIVGWVVDLVELIGAPGVGLAVALENLFPPIPSEVVLPLAGLAAARGDVDLVSAIVWATAGSLVGALALFGIGAALGRDRMRALADRIPLMERRDVLRAEKWFERHGAAAVLFGRMIPLIRSLISVPAGVTRMPWPLFAVLTAAGSLIWNSGFILAGYWLGAEWETVSDGAGIASKVVLAALGAVVLGLLARRARRRSSCA